MSSDEPRGEMRLILAKLIALENRLRLLESMDPGADVSELGAGPGPQVVSEAGVNHPWKVTYSGTTFDVATGYVVAFDSDTSLNITPPSSASASGLAAPAAGKFAAIYLKIERTAPGTIALTIAKDSDANTAEDAYKVTTDRATGTKDYIVLAIVSGDSPADVDQRKFEDLYPNVLSG